MTNTIFEREIPDALEKWQNIMFECRVDHSSRHFFCGELFCGVWIQRRNYNFRGWENVVGGQ